MTIRLESSIKNAAHKAVSQAEETAEKATHRTRLTVLDGIHMVASAFTALGGLGKADALGWFGLQRRRGPLMPILTFGAGFLAGAAAGVLFAPLSGDETRDWIANRAATLGAPQDASAPVASKSTRNGVARNHRPRHEPSSDERATT